MAILYTRMLVVPVWLLAFGLVIVFAPPPGIVANGLVVGGALVAVAVLLLGKRFEHTSASDGLQTIEVRPTSVEIVRQPRRRQRWTSRW